MLFLNSSKLLLEITVLVSSANSNELAILFRVKEKSFMYIRKSNGPNIEPRGTDTVFYWFPFTG
jgi:hypothetical protein